jgi:hypothetical protein
MAPPKGAELLMARVPGQTDVDGRFELASERVLSIVRGAGWNVVSLSFARSGYQPFHTNWLGTNFTLTSKAEPVVDVGRVLLQPGPK